MGVFTKVIVYVAGPYSGDKHDRHMNTETAIHIGIALLQRGHVPMIPHLSHYVDIEAQKHKVDIPYRIYIEWDQLILGMCNAMLKVWPSPGVDEEEQFALENGIVVYHSLDEVPCENERLGEGGKRVTLPQSKPIDSIYTQRVMRMWAENPEFRDTRDWHKHNPFKHIYYRDAYVDRHGVKEVVLYERDGLIYYGIEDTNENVNGREGEDT